MRLEDLQPRSAVRGVYPDGPVTVVSVQWFGSEALELTYKTASGTVADELLYRHDETRLDWSGGIAQWGSISENRFGPDRFGSISRRAASVFPGASPAPVSACRLPAGPMCTGDAADSTTVSRSVPGPGVAGRVQQGTVPGRKPLLGNRSS